MVNSRDIPNEKMKQTNVPKGAGHVGAVLQAGGIEGIAKYTGKESIGKNSQMQGKKSAGMVGSSNVNAA